MILCLNYAFLATDKYADLTFYIIIADCYLKLGVTEKALEYYCLALKDKKNSTRCFIGLSRCFIELKKYELAFLYINKAIESDKKSQFMIDIQSIAMFLQSDKILKDICKEYH